MPRFQQQLPGRASSGNGETLQREAMAGCSAAGHSQLGLSAAGHSQLGLSTACFTYSTTRPWNSLLIKAVLAAKQNRFIVLAKKNLL